MERFTDNIRDSHFEMLRKQILFSGMTDSEIMTFIFHSNPYYISLAQGTEIIIEKEVAHYIAMIISGTAHIFSVDYMGNKTMIKSFEYGESTGTLHSMLDYSNTLIQFKAFENTEIIFVEPESVFRTDEAVAVEQQKMLVNLVNSQRRLFNSLSQHIACLSQRSIREKILKFLQICTERYKAYEFEIPFSREELADYLAVDRASLSRSLSELRDQDVIEFRKNKFKVKTTRYFVY